MSRIDTEYWVVAVQGDTMDLDTISGALREADVGLAKAATDSSYLLTSRLFDELDDPSSVQEAASALLDVINGAGALVDPGFRALVAGHVHRVQSDSTKTTFVSITSTVSVRSHTNTTLPNSPVSRLEPATTSKIDKGLAASAVDLGLERALRLHGQHPRTFISLYKVFELTQEHPDSQTWFSKTQRSRFKHSANSPSAHGDLARHAVQPSKPPTNPMSLKDAETFVTVILGRWVDAVWGSIRGR